MDPLPKKFFLPVRVLSRLFRGKLLAFLREAYAKGKLQFSGQLAALADPARFQVWLRTLKKTEWVVYAKPPFRRTRTRIEVSGPLHASGGHLQRQTAEP